MRKGRISFSGLATIRLNEMARVAAVVRDRGGVLNYAAWLKAIANTIAAAESRDTSTPRQYRRLSYTSLTYHMARCGIRAEDDKIRAQIDETRAWRQALADDGRPFRPLMSADALGELLGVTDEIREAAQAWNIGTIDGSKGVRAKAREERKKQARALKRRESGAMNRKDYEGKSLTKTKPWDRDGISRRTWERRRKARAGASDASMSPPQVCPHQYTEVTQVCPRQYLITRDNVSSRSPLETDGSLDTSPAASASPFCIRKKPRGFTVTSDRSGGGDRFNWIEDSFRVAKPANAPAPWQARLLECEEA